MRRLSFAAIALWPALATAQVVGRFASVQGPVHVERGGASLDAAPAMELSLGEIVRTAAEGRAKILFEDGSVLNLGGDTRLKLTRFLYDPAGERTGFVELLRGAIRAWVTRLRTPKSRFEVQTPTAVAGVRGTDYALIETEQGSQIVVYDGVVTVRSADQNVVGECVARRGMACEVFPSRAVGPAVPAPLELQQKAAELTRVASRPTKDSVRLAALLRPRVRAHAAARADWGRIGLGRRLAHHVDRYRGREGRDLPGQGASLGDTIVPTKLVELLMRARIGGRF